MFNSTLDINSGREWDGLLKGYQDVAVVICVCRHDLMTSWPHPLTSQPSAPRWSRDGPTASGPAQGETQHWLWPAVLQEESALYPATTGCMCVCIDGVQLWLHAVFSLWIAINPKIICSTLNPNGHEQKRLAETYRIFGVELCLHVLHHCKVLCRPGTWTQVG